MNSEYDENYTEKNGESSQQDPLYSLSYENARLEDENRNLRRTVQFYQTELEKFRTPPFLVSEVLSLTQDGKAIIKLPNQSSFFVEISQEFEGELQPGDTVLNEQKSLVVVDKVDTTKNFSIESILTVNKNPQVSWKDIGGLKEEVSKVKEVLELPLTQPKKFEKMGVVPPKGVLLYGPPGTGKTMIAKSLASETNATFIELVGSELVQKFIGEGAKLVKDLFEYARKKSPTIIFIDELDAIAAKRIESGTSGEREVQRTFMQLLGELDGFDPLSDVKIVAATNRVDIIDEAMLRPGRLERHIEVELPDREGRAEILALQTKGMKIDSNVKFDDIAVLTENFSGADLKAMSTEAGYSAIKAGRDKISQEDFKTAVEVLKESKKEYELLNPSFH